VLELLGKKEFGPVCCFLSYNFCNGEKHSDCFLNYITPTRLPAIHAIKSQLDSFRWGNNNSYLLSILYQSGLHTIFLPLADETYHLHFTDVENEARDSKYLVQGHTINEIKLAIPRRSV
jgi:hypothetical protein